MMDGELAQAWNHAKRVLRSRAKNDVEASNALIMMRRMENSETTFEVEVGDVFGAHGASLGTHAMIDTDAIRGLSAAGLSIGVGSVLVHEAGHLAYQNSPMYALRPDGEASN